MNPKLELYYKPTCPFCLRVLDAMKSMKVEVELKNIVADPSAKDTLMRVGGKTQVPCLFIDGKPLYESADIIAYLQKLDA